MHQVLHISEILFNIFCHCSNLTTPLCERNYPADLAVLARTCKTFQEPALDVLWGELYDLSPLARCLPEACRLVEPAERHRWPRYLFSRPLKEEEWDTLRGYTRRVRFIHGSIDGSTSLNEETIGVIFSRLAPFSDALFPRLRTLWWREAFGFAPVHVAVPSLTLLRLDLLMMEREPARELFNTFGDRCPHIKKLVVDVDPSGPIDSISEVVSPAISHQICRWKYLRHVHCLGIALNMHAILHLSSTPALEWLAFTLEDTLMHDISHLGSTLVFSDLTDLYIDSECLDIIASLLPRIRLPAIKTIRVTMLNNISRQAIQGYWAGIQNACPFNAVETLELHAFNIDVICSETNELLQLSFEDLRPCTAFAELRELHITLECSVSLTDTDLLELASPRMEKLLINDDWGWQIDVDEGGITLSGLVQLLRQCPLLKDLCLAIDARTFTEIPEGLDVSFPPRRLKIDFLDSCILPEFVAGMVSVLATLGLDPSMLQVWEVLARGFLDMEHYPVWKCVLDGLKDVAAGGSLQ